MDKTLLDLISLLIAGAGLFAVLTKFNVRQLRATYFGENPYALKRDEIERVMTWLLHDFFRSNSIHERLEKDASRLSAFALRVVKKVYKAR